MKFSHINDLVDKINNQLGPFCKSFQYKRKELTKSLKSGNKNKLFVPANKNRNWTINEGGGTEVQYHLAIENDILRYGLGFNTQYVPFANDKSPVEYITPFIDSFLELQKELSKLMPDYSIVYGSEDQLFHPKNGQYTLWGKEIALQPTSGGIEIKDSDFKQLLDDLKMQFIPYQIIFEKRNNISKMNKDIGQIIRLIKYKKQIILQGPPGTGKTRLAKEIAAMLIPNKEFDPRDINELIYPGVVISSATNYTEYTVLSVGSNSVQVQLKKEGTNYHIPIKDIERAYQIKLWEGGQKNGSDPYAAALAKHIFQNQLSNAKYSKLIQFHPAYTYEDFVRGIVVETNDGAQPEYKVVDKVLAEFARKAMEDESSNYVLIIDEINRANLPSVLGELIYALEYRFDPNKPEETTVESMYFLRDGGASETAQGRALRLPNNLFIIGTMNTADRSVGHIDYAIRRRFAFVEVLPSIEPIKNESAREYFKKVSKLFVSNYEEAISSHTVPMNSSCLASDFTPEEVWIGHSYFITDKEGDAGDTEIKTKMKYEVLPLIKEYVKDGILNSDQGNSGDPVQIVVNELSRL